MRTRGFSKPTKASLYLGIEKGQSAAIETGDIGFARPVSMWKVSVFSVVREMVGHAIGRNLHESPRGAKIMGRRGRGVKLQEGMVICIEPMVNAGGREVLPG
jgi:methionyl aminopeptidase